MNCSSLWRVLSAVALIAFAASASAGDWDDCPKVAEPARAVPACTRIIGKEKNRRQMAIAYANRCGAHNAKGQLEAAKADCDKAIDLNPGYVGGHLNRGNTYLKMKDFDGALRNYNKAIDLDPKVAIAYANRGQVHGHNRQFVRAIADFEKAVSLAPDNFNNRHGLVITLIQARQYDKAREHVWRLVQARPTNLRVQRYAIQIGKKAGDKALLSVALALVEKYSPAEADAVKRYLQKP